MMPSQQSFRKRKSILRLSKWIALGLPILLASWYLIVRADFASEANTYQIQLQRAKKHHFILSPQELNGGASIPDSQNALGKYRMLVEAFDRVPDYPVPPNVRARDRAIELPGDNALRLAETYLKDRKVPLDVVKQAAALPHFAFVRKGIQLEIGDSAIFPKVQESIRLLTIDALIQVRRGNIDAGVSRFRQAIQVEKHIAEDKSYVSALRFGTADNSITLGIETAATFAADSDVALAKLSSLMNELPPVQNVLEFLRGEVGFGYQASLAAGDESKGDALQNAISTGKLFPLPFEKEMCKRAYAATILDFWNDTFDEIQQGGESDEAIATALKNLSDKVQASYSRTSQIAQLFLPIYSSSNEPIVLMHKQRLCVKAVLAALRYRLETQHLPYTLSEIKNPEFNLLDEKKLIYFKTAGGFRIYAPTQNDKEAQGKYNWELESIRRGRTFVLCSFPSWERYSPQSRNVTAEEVKIAESGSQNRLPAPPVRRRRVRAG